ncbi:TetR/AcrR family transcriptional regulator [Aquibaculum sediminis]|uniref:TetR/AcrR family transcriptional regulator n=1 Tax=Aquibaculum sediminis TaxID=3231907 RepID=UPI003456BFE0
MSWQGRRRDGYHHGNLREALVAAALDLMAEKGPAGFTFAEAARAAGVSAAAPYRHYSSREDLMAEVARRGFERFTHQLAQAWDEGRPRPLEAFYRLGKAYLTFARNEPAYYTAMFEAQIPPSYNRELQQAADAAFDVLRDAAQALAATLPPDQRPPSLMVSLHIWSLAHGIASLFGRGDKARRSLPMAPEDLLEAGVLVYLQGLGLGDGAN